ncbi:hypothetical protein GKC28_16090 [Leisingera sp. ANG59]|nr:hypothetical protein [Leisingera sp. ANG59]
MGRSLRQNREIVLQAKIPKVAKREKAEVLRDLIGQFLRANLTQDLSERKHKAIGSSVPQPKILKTDALPTVIRSIRISTEMDAELAEFAGIMQMTKRDVVRLAITMGVERMPWELNLDNDFLTKRRGSRSFQPKWSKW